MDDEQQKKVLNAFQLVLRPIIKILLRYGISYGQFAEAVKTSFVEVGSTDFGIRGRPTNISRVAVMTGLTRKEVRRLRDKIEDGSTTVTVRTTPLTEVVTRWHTEKEFLDEQSLPRTLQFGGTPNSFSDLVKRHGGDVPAGAIRTELKRMGLVDENDDGSITIRTRTVVPRDSTDNLVTCLVHSIYPLFSTVVKNTDPDIGKGDGYAQFTTFSRAISSEDKARLKRISYDRLSDTAISFDDLFATFDGKSGESGDVLEEKMPPNPVVSVGLYYFEETDPNAKYEW